MPQSGTDQHPCRLSVREGTYHFCAAFDLSIDPLQGVVCPDPHPMFFRKTRVGQGFLHAVMHFVGSFGQLHPSQLCFNSFGLFQSSCFIFLGMDRFEHLSHFFDLFVGSDCKNVPVKMYDAALIFRMRKHLADCFDHSQSFIADDQTGVFKTALLQPNKEVFPTLEIFLQAFCCTYDLAVSVTGNSNGYEDGDIFLFFTPAAFQEDTININIRIVIFELAVSPLLDVLICLFVPVADCSGRYLCPPKCFGDIFQ